MLVESELVVLTAVLNPVEALVESEPTAPDVLVERDPVAVESELRTPLELVDRLVIVVLSPAPVLSVTPEPPVMDRI